MKLSIVRRPYNAHTTFNTLSGSYRDEASLLTPYLRSHSQSFNTLSGSYRDEAMSQAILTRKMMSFQYPQRVVPG